MKGTGGVLVTALLVIAAAQAAAAALSVLLLLAIIYGVFVYPRETFGLITLCIMAGLIQRHPLACLGLITLIAATKLFKG